MIACAIAQKGKILLKIITQSFFFFLKELLKQNSMKITKHVPRFRPNSGEVEKELMAHKEWRKITRDGQLCGAVTEQEIQRENKENGKN